MKLYYIANARIPHKKAYAIQIAKMCEAFVKEGVELELVIPKQSELVDSIEDYYKLSVPIRVKNLPVIDLYARGKWGFFISGLSFMISYSLYIFSEIIRGEKGVIYTIDMDTFSFIASIFLGMPCFLETHGGKAKTWINKIFFKYAKGIIVINNIIKKQIAEVLVYPENKILVWPNGIDLDLFKEIPQKDARAKLSLPERAKIVMYSGRFYGWKGLEVLADAASKLPPNIFVYIVGGTREEFSVITKKNKLFPNLVFSGEKPYTEIPLWLSAADALLVLGTKHDTQSYYYTSPMKVFEYLAMKRPIIASKTPAVQDIVSSKEVIFYEPDDPNDLASKMILSVGGEESIYAKISAAFVKARDFTWEKRAREVTDFIKRNI